MAALWLTKHLILPCSTGDQRSACGVRGCERRSAHRPLPEIPEQPRRSPHATSHCLPAPRRGLPRKLGCSGAGTEWDKRLRRLGAARLLFSSFKVGAVVRGPGEGGAKCGTSHPQTDSSAGTQVRNRSRRGTWLGVEKREANGGGAGSK